MADVSGWEFIMAIGMWMYASMWPGDDSFLNMGLIVRKLMRTLLYCITRVQASGSLIESNRLGSIQYMRIV